MNIKEFFKRDNLDEMQKQTLLKIESRGFCLLWVLLLAALARGFFRHPFGRTSLALLLAGIEVSVVSLVGFVMLVGVIVNNGIVLVDYINQLRLEGMGRREAIIEAGVTRLRPILMTSLTTILGLVVMAFGKDVGTALMQPVALVCIGGLLYATLMTLLVVPCMYDILSRRDLRKVNEEELQLLDL